MVHLWLRNEIFEGVLPLKTMGALQGVSSLPSTNAISEASIMGSLAALVRAFRSVHPDLVGYPIVWPADEQAASPRTRAGSGASSGSASPTRSGLRAGFGGGSPGALSPRAFGFAGGYGAAGSPVSPRPGRALRLHSKGADEAHRLAFIKRHLHDLLRLVSPAAADALSAAAAASDPAAAAAFAVARADLSALGFLIAGGRALDDASQRDLCDLCPLAGGGATRGPVGSAAEVADWLAAALTVNDVLYPAPPPLPTAAPALPLESLAAAAAAAEGGGGGEEGEGDMRSSSPPGGGGGGALLTPVKGKGGAAAATTEPVRVAAPARAGVPLVVNGAARTTVMHAAAAGARAERSLQVSHCHESYVYMLAPFQYATVLGCSECTIVVGAAAGVVRLEDCTRVTLIAACRRACAVNCCECALHLYAPSRPLFVGDNRACQVAPYNAAYPRLRAHLAACGLLPPLPPPGDAAAAAAAPPPPRNMWFSPLDLNAAPTVVVAAAAAGGGALTPRTAAKAGADEAHPHALASASAVTQMPPDAFHCVSIPACAGGDEDEAAGSAAAAAAAAREATQALNPFPLPPEYANKLREREALLQQLQQVVQGAQLSPRQQRELEEAVRGRFTEWLVSSGHLRQVLDLVHLERGPPPPSGWPASSEGADAVGEGAWAERSGTSTGLR
ncbi:tubulin binding cofactor C-domain-containing protein [Tribonema minus]|uniref:Tubulin binding cofactor C-domain-containing protein n=1 Tax=Tribonema minus TaxID=303371 RepID=A0A836CDT4_9STRA|nr:tubulin binding cofactor C-domain-containing protein [Tribonema minus]